MPNNTKKNGRLDAAKVAEREKWVLEFFKKHPKATKDDANAALIAVKHLGGMKMRPVRVYEIARAAKSGASEVPRVEAGKRPSRQQVAQAAASKDTGPTSAQRIGRGPRKGGGDAVEIAKQILLDAGYEDISIKARPPARMVTA